MPEETTNDVVVAVLIQPDLFSGLQSYLATRPYNEVNQLIEVMNKQTGINAESLALLQAPATKPAKK